MYERIVSFLFITLQYFLSYFSPLFSKFHIPQEEDNKFGIARRAISRKESRNERIHSKVTSTPSLFDVSDLEKGGNRRSQR